MNLVYPKYIAVAASASTSITTSLSKQTEPIMPKKENVYSQQFHEKREDSGS